ncbi:vanadium-dependent haloperoxidase [Pseudalkalibacillus sp. SCS-8]|uniref:vanadium-dependent haloperoxidase n=1 Tax=Pseudalkalibacillus nanhaiensis TaxID=3115291 RepID=UPI0032DBC7DA
MSKDYLKWSKLPYGGEEFPPDNPIDPMAISWPTYYIKRRGKRFFSPKGLIRFDLKKPEEIDWDHELTLVKRTLENVTDEQVKIAKYWGAGAATKQWTPIIDKLIDTYGCTAPYAARLLAAVQAGVNDTFVVCWHYKYLWDVARPVQYDIEMLPILCSPRFPTYPSGHAAVSGCVEVILSYFFPGEAVRLRELAEENAMSRLYAGVHFPIDNDEGLKLGRRVGEIVVSRLQEQRDQQYAKIDHPFTEYIGADLLPPPYEQAMPYPFKDTCTSNKVCDETRSEEEASEENSFEEELEYVAKKELVSEKVLDERLLEAIPHSRSMPHPVLYIPKPRKR